MLDFSIIDLLNIFINPLFLIIFSIGVLIITFVSFLTFGRMWFKTHVLRRSYVDCRILKEYSDSYKVITQRFINIKNNTFTLDTDKEYIIDLNNALFKRDLKPILYYDINHINPINIRSLSKQIKNKSSPVLLKTIIKNNTLGKIFSSSPDKMLVIICISLLIGMVILTIFSFWQINELQNTILRLTEELAKRPPPIIPD